MPWNSLWSDFVKKRACRYLLNRYLGQFLQEKLTLDQLSVDLYNGTGVIKDLSLDVVSLNEALNTYNIPFEIVDGFVGSITVNVPWSALIYDSTEVAVDGLELTIQPKQREDNGSTLEEMFTSMTSMTSSLQLAQEVLREDAANESSPSNEKGGERFEGVEKFAQTIDSVLSRVKVTLSNTTIRLEHLPKEASVGVALELRIKRIEYFDDLAESHRSDWSDKTPHIMEQAAFCHKNLRLMGVTMYADEFNRASRTPSTKGSSVDSQAYETENEPINPSMAFSSLHASTVTSQPMGTGFPFVLTEPVKIAMLTGTQEMKIKLKQNDSLQGPKLEIDSHFGSLHALLTPRQVHILLELAHGLSSPGTSDNSNSSHPSHKNKPMEADDYGRVESELQRQLHGGRFQGQGMDSYLSSAANHPNSIMVQHSLDSSDDEVYFSMHANKPHTAMDTSFTSSQSSATNTSKTSSHSTLKCSSSIPLSDERRESIGRAPKSTVNKDFVQKFHDDTGAELTRYKLKLGFCSLTILHENPASTPGDVLTPGVTAAEKLHSLSETFFNKTGVLSTVGHSVDLAEPRRKFSEACPHDHLGFLAKPISLEFIQKTSAYKKSLSLDLTISRLEAVEALFDRNDNTMSSHGFSLPIHNKLPEYCELLVFEEDGFGKAPYEMFSSIHASTPCVKLKLDNVETNKSSHRKHVPPRTDVVLELGRFTSEVDITIVDRIHTLMNPHPLTPDPSSTRLYTSYNPNINLGGGQCLSEDAMIDELPGEDRTVNMTLTAAYAQIHFRFPIPILGTGPQVGRLAWWKRCLRKEILIAELTELCFQTKFVPVDNLQQYEVNCKEVHGQLQEAPGKEPISFIHIRQDVDASTNGNEDEFNWPRLVIKVYSEKSSVLEEEQDDSDDSIPMDSLNGACQFAKPELSPFSSRKNLYEKEELSGKSEVTHTSEEMVLPGEKEEVREFMEKAVSNTRLAVELCLPDVTAVLPSKHFFEVLYNRVNNDLLLWSPKAPSPIQPQEYPVFPSQSAMNSVRVTQFFQEGTDHFQLCKSALNYDSDSDSDDTMDPLYSIHDHHRKENKRRREGRQLPSKLCFSINITKGKVLGCIPIKTETGEVSEEHQGEIILAVEDATVFVVSSYRGDKDLEYICVQANKSTLYHDNCVAIPSVWPPRNQTELSSSVNQQLGCAIYKSEPGVDSKLAGQVGCGQDSNDMLAVAVKIKLDTLNNIKEFTVALGVRGATLRHRMLPSGCSWISQYNKASIAMAKIIVEEYKLLQSKLARPLTQRPVIAYKKNKSLKDILVMDFLDVEDYPIQGYVEPKVITELHVHLWSCAIDYRPLHLPQRAMLTLEAFSVSSNIVTGSSTSLLRFLIDDAALFISEDLKETHVDLKKNYVCVLDIERFELSLKSADGKDLKSPKTDLRISTNKVNIRTCSDSGKALTDLIQYFASDGDLEKRELNVSSHSESAPVSPGIANVTKEERTRSSSSSSGGLSESRMEHVQDLMVDAMRESSSSASGSESPVRQKPKNTTQVFFYATEGASDSDDMCQSGEREEPRTDILLPLISDNPEDSDHFGSKPNHPVTSPDGRRVFSPRQIVISDSQDSIYSGSSPERTDHLTEEEEFCIITQCDNPGLGIAPKDGQPIVRKFAEGSIELQENYFSQPLGRGDLLKAPEHFPPAIYRYTLKEMNVVWQMYGGRDFGPKSGKKTAQGEEKKLPIKEDRKPHSPKHRGKEMLSASLPWQCKGGAARDHDTLLELNLTKVRFQHEVYPDDREQASRQVLLIHDVEVRDRLASSRINKFLYQYSSESQPRQSNANMVLIKALHSRPDITIPAQECSLRVSLLPIRLNVDQDALFFLRKFFTEMSGSSLKDPPVSKATRPPSVQGSPSSPSSKPAPSMVTPPPVMAVGDTIEKCDNLVETINLIKFDEISQAEQEGEPVEMEDMSEVERKQPVFFKSFAFSPEVPIRLDYHGKRVSMEQGTIAGVLAGLAQLNCSELKLKAINHKHGLLGTDKLLQFTLGEWLGDIKKNQIPGILGGVGPMYSFVQIVQGIRDLFWLPVEQYQRDGRIMRGIQRGATSFTTSTAMAVLELTNRLVQSVQYVAELTYDMVSPGPGVRIQQNQYQQLQRKIKKSVQPSDLREGVAKAYGVLKEGISGTAKNIVKVATEEHDQKGLTGAVGGVLREIPPTLVQPVILASAATSNVLGGMRNQLRPDAKREDEEKWKLQGDGS